MQVIRKCQDYGRRRIVGLGGDYERFGGHPQQMSGHLRTLRGHSQFHNSHEHMTINYEKRVLYKKTF